MPQAKHLNITQVTSFQLLLFIMFPSPSSSIFSSFCFSNSTFFSTTSRVFVICAPLSWQALVTWWLISMFQDPKITTAKNDDDGNPHSCFLGEGFPPKPQDHKLQGWRWLKPSLLFLGRGWKPSSLLLLGRGLLPKPPGHNTALQGQVHPVIVIIISINTREQHFKYYLANFLPFLIWFWGTMPPHPPHSASVGRHTLQNLEFSEKFHLKGLKMVKKGH